MLWAMWIRAALGCAVVGGCSSEPQLEILGVEVAETCPDDPNALFFPTGTFESDDLNPNINVVRNWYSSVLSETQESSLSCGEWSYQESYRFVWLRTYEAPLTVRVFRDHKDVHLEAVILKGTGGFGATGVSQRISKRVSMSQWKELLVAVEKSNLWELSSELKGYDALDGAQWIIEVRKGDRYHMVDRPSGDVSVQQIGLKLLELAELTDLVGPIY